MYSFDLEPVPTVYRGTGMRKESVSELVKSVPLSLGSIFVLLYEITNENFAMLDRSSEAFSGVPN